MAADIAADKQFIAKVLDIAERAERTCSPLFTKFLREEESALAISALDKSVYRNNYAVYGGFSQSERNMLGFFPDYLSETAKMTPEDFFPISAVKVDGSGYRSLCHRDFLGALLALGITRESVGDIFVKDEKTAYIALTDKLSGFVSEELCAVGSDKVKTAAVSLCELPEIVREFEEIDITVASPRLDGVISAFLHLSRDKAEKLILTGDVNVNHTEVCDKSFPLSEGDLISVRGFGRYRLHSFGGQSKKGRTRVTVYKYI